MLAGRLGGGELDDEDPVVIGLADHDLLALEQVQHARPPAASNIGCTAARYSLKYFASPPSGLKRISSTSVSAWGEAAGAARFDLLQHALAAGHRAGSSAFSA
jgi:hypothetical protein